MPTWLRPEQALHLESHVDRLLGRGESFTISLTSASGRYLTAEGRAIGGSAVLKLADVSGVKRDLADLAHHHQQLQAEADALRAIVEALPAPAWVRDADGRIAFVNSAYARAVEAPDASSAVAAGRELLDSATRADLERGRTEGASVMRRAAVIVAGARRIFDVIDVPVAGGSAGIGLDATEVETLRAEIARTVLAHRRTLDQLTTAVAMFGADHKLAFYNSAYRTLWDIEPGFLDETPTDSAVLDRLRAARRLPEQQDFRVWKAQLHEAYRATEPKEFEWHLPDLRTLRVVTTPNPDGGVTYLFDDVTERLNLERRFDALIRVQRETLDNLSEAVAVFGSDGRVRLFNPVFAKMWGLAPDALDQRPHIEAVIVVMPGVPCRGNDLADAAQRRHRARGPQPEDPAHRAHRRQRHRLPHRAAARRGDAGHLPRHHRFRERRARSHRTQRGAGGGGRHQDRFRPTRLLRAALAAHQHHRLHPFPGRSPRPDR